MVHLVASADSHVAIFSLNWESYWSHAYGWNLRLDLAMKGTENTCINAPGF